MIQEEIFEGNRLIAIFNRDIDNSYKWDGYKFTNEVNYIMPEYHSSWDWLMPVIERIEFLGYKWEIGMSSTLPYHYCKIWSIGTIEEISPLDAIYGAVIEFIKWYNNNKEIKKNK